MIGTPLLLAAGALVLLLVAAVPALRREQRGLTTTTRQRRSSVAPTGRHAQVQPHGRHAAVPTHLLPEDYTGRIPLATTDSPAAHPAAPATAADLRIPAPQAMPGPMPMIPVPTTTSPTDVPTGALDQAEVYADTGAGLLDRSAAHATQVGGRAASRPVEPPALPARRRAPAEERAHLRLVEAA